MPPQSPHQEATYLQRFCKRRSRLVRRMPKKLINRSEYGVGAAPKLEVRKMEIYINLVGELFKPLAGSFRYTFNPNNVIHDFKRLWQDMALEVPGWVDMKTYKEDLNRKAYFAYIIASGPQKGPQPISAAVPNIPNRTMKDWMKLMDSIEKEN